MKKRILIIALSLCVIAASTGSVYAAEPELQGTAAEMSAEAESDTDAIMAAESDTDEDTSGEPAVPESFEEDDASEMIEKGAPEEQPSADKTTEDGVKEQPSSPETSEEKAEDPETLTPEEETPVSDPDAPVSENEPSLTESEEGDDAPVPEDAAPAEPDDTAETAKPENTDQESEIEEPDAEEEKPVESARAGGTRSGTCGKNLTWTLDDEGLLTISGKGSMSDDPAWVKNEVRSVKIENGVTSIGKNAFYDCINLAEITLPSSITRIGAAAFQYCRRLRKITIPSRVTAIADSTFRFCDSLSDITIPSGVTAIGKYAFANCIGLTDLALPSGATTIGESAFFFCTNLNSITIPSGVTAISECAFEYCFSLKKVTIPDSVTEIGGSAFKECRRLANVTIPSGTARIGAAAFEYCSGLTGLTLQEGVTEIGADAFSACGLEKVTIPKSVTEIGSYALGYDTLQDDEGFDEWHIPMEGFTIAGYADSAAEQYAQENGFAFVYLVKVPQSITVSADAAAVGETGTVSVTGAEGKLSYSSADPSIATVNSGGVFRGRKVGTVQITVTAAATAKYKKASKTITVKVVPGRTGAITTSNKAAGIKISWEKVTGADGYYIYRKTGNGSYSRIQTITGGSTLTFTDKSARSNGTKYVYRIRAFSSAAGGSTQSLSKATYYMSRPEVSSVLSKAPGWMTVSWTKNTAGNGYQIEYSPSETFEYGSKTKTINNAEAVTKALPGMKNGTVYYARVRSFKSVGGKKYYSPWSGAKSTVIRRG